jgi:hypothetical protein
MGGITFKVKALFQEEGPETFASDAKSIAEDFLHVVRKIQRKEMRNMNAIGRNLKNRADGITTGARPGGSARTR